MASDTLRIFVLPIEVCRVYHQEPRPYLAIASRVAASRRSFASPTAKSWPIRCVSVREASVLAAQDTVCDPDGLDIGVVVGLAATSVGLASAVDRLTVGVGFAGAGVELGAVELHAARMTAKAQIRMRIRTSLGRRRGPRCCAH
jgi:hypothetical protein